MFETLYLSDFTRMTFRCAATFNNNHCHYILACYLLQKCMASISYHRFIRVHLYMYNVHCTCHGFIAKYCLLALTATYASWSRGIVEKMRSFYNMITHAICMCIQYRYTVYIKNESEMTSFGTQCVLRRLLMIFLLSTSNEPRDISYIFGFNRNNASNRMNGINTR